MRLLKRALLLQSAVWAVCGIAIAVVPRFVLETMFRLEPLPDVAYVRIAGIFAFALSLLMVLVSRRLEDLWWYSWAFVIASAGSAVVALLNALVGVPEGSSPALWWLFAAASATFTVGLLAGLAKAGVEQPPI